jgi:hypothetical protein
MVSPVILVAVAIVVIAVYILLTRRPKNAPPTVSVGLPVSESITSGIKTLAGLTLSNSVYESIIAQWLTWRSTQCVHPKPKTYKLFANALTYIISSLGRMAFTTAVSRSWEISLNLVRTNAGSF